MKTHAIIPIFVPHEGCPNDCCFCNQRVITAREKAPDKAETVRIIESHLKQLGKNPGISHIEIAFYGGSFTGISMERQAEYLSIAERYKEAGRVQAIHLSTRPDYINEEILDQLTFFGTDVVELGVQSFDEEVFAAVWPGAWKRGGLSKRGNDKGAGNRLGHPADGGASGRFLRKIHRVGKGSRSSEPGCGADLPCRCAERHSALQDVSQRTVPASDGSGCCAYR